MDLFIVTLTAALLTSFAVPLVIKLAKRYQLVDDPIQNPHPKKVHSTPIPRAGGLAIFIGVIFSIFLFIPIEKHILGIILGSSILLIMGIVDDKVTNFSPYLRLSLLFLAAGCAVASGIGISFITNPFGGILRLDELIIPFNFLGTHSIVVLADIFAFLWIVTITQVINWSKGVDGQMPGITLVAALVLGFLSLRFYAAGDIDQLQVAKLAFITAGASLGFLIFNWYPAKIFPGFSGSTILAFLLAVLSILSGAKVATALLVMAIPTVDFVYTIIRRISRGKSPVWGDRGHLHHKLLDIGWKAPQISLFYMVGSGILGTVALSVSTTSKIYSLIAVSLVFTIFILWINSFGESSKK